MSLMMISLNAIAQYSPQTDTPTLPELDPIPVQQYYWNMSGSTASNLTGSRLGTKNAYPLYIITDNTARMTIDTAGNIGVGTDIPHQMLHIVDGNMLISRTSTRAPGSTNGSLLFGNHTTNSAPYGRWGIEYLSEDGVNGLNFWKPYTSTEATVNYVFFLNDNGNVGIGTCDPQAKLAVNGEILAKSVRVNTSSEYWPDYVFSSDYELMSLDELENYITYNKHLPGIISAEEVRHQGDVDLGEMNVKLLEKIEELTLYIINLQKQIDELKNIKE